MYKFFWNWGFFCYNLPAIEQYFILYCNFFASKTKKVNLLWLQFVCCCKAEIQQVFLLVDFGIEKLNNKNRVSPSSLNQTSANQGPDTRLVLEVISKPLVPRGWQRCLNGVNSVFFSKGKFQIFLFYFLVFSFVKVVNNYYFRVLSLKNMQQILNLVNTRRRETDKKRKKWRHPLKHQSYEVAPSDSICVVVEKYRS